MNNFTLETPKAVYVCTRLVNSWKIEITSIKSEFLSENGDVETPAFEGTLVLNGNNARTRIFQFIDSIDANIT